MMSFLESNKALTAQAGSISGAFTCQARRASKSMARAVEMRPQLALRSVGVQLRGKHHAFWFRQPRGKAGGFIQWLAKVRCTGGVVASAVRSTKISIFRFMGNVQDFQG